MSQRDEEGRGAGRGSVAFLLNPRLLVVMLLFHREYVTSYCRLNPPPPLHGDGGGGGGGPDPLPVPPLQLEFYPLGGDPGDQQPRSHIATSVDTRTRTHV